MASTTQATATASGPTASKSSSIFMKKKPVIKRVVIPAKNPTLTRIHARNLAFDDFDDMCLRKSVRTPTPASVELARKLSIAEDKIMAASLVSSPSTPATSASLPVAVAHWVSPRPAARLALRRPVPISPDTSATKQWFYGIESISSSRDEVAFNLYALDICVRWDWPHPDTLPRDAKARVSKEVGFLDRARGLVAAKGKDARKIVKIEKELGVLQGSNGFGVRRERTKLEKQIAELQMDLLITKDNMETLSEEYDASYAKEMVWEGLKKTDLWDDRKVSKKEKDVRTEKWEKRQEMLERGRRRYKASAPLAVQQGLVEKNLKREAVTPKKTTRQTAPRSVKQVITERKQTEVLVKKTVTRAASPPRSPTPEPASRKRKRSSGWESKVDFGAESEGEDMSDEQFEMLMKEEDRKRQRRIAQREAEELAAEEERVARYNALNALEAVAGRRRSSGSCSGRGSGSRRTRTPPSPKTPIAPLTPPAPTVVISEEEDERAVEMVEQARQEMVAMSKELDDELFGCN